jgi:hypothetical protein
VTWWGVGTAAGGDVVLLHRLQECGLGLGWRAVDLVRQEHVCENRSLHEDEAPLAGQLVLLDDLGAGDVRRHQVGCELDSLESERERPGQRADEECLREAGNADEHTVTAGENGDEKLFDDLVLSDDDAPDLGSHAVVSVSEPLQRGEVFMCRRSRRGDGGQRWWAPVLSFR